MGKSKNSDDIANPELREPLLQGDNAVAVPSQEQSLAASSVKRHVPSANADDNGGVDEDNNANRGESPHSFCIRTEIIDMLHLALPLAVSFFCRMGMASTDSAFVGHIHNGQHSAETYLAAAVLSDMVLNICITPPLAFNQVLNGLVSQAIGSGNPSMAGVWLQQSMFWLSLTMLPCLSGLFYVRPILEMLGFPSDIAALAGTYAKYNWIWAIPNGWYQCMRFYFQARGLPRPAMYNNFLFLGINALLNWFFVFGGPTKWKGLGFIGAAISISISRTMQGLVYFLYMFVLKKHHLAAWPDQGWSFRHHTKERTYEFMKQSLPNIGTLLFQSFASQATTVLVGRLGELSIAASSALSTVTMPWTGTLSATCCTVSGVRVGYHLGRGDGAAAKCASWIVMHFITVVNVIMAIVFLVPCLKDKIMNIATNDENVVALAEKLVPAMLIGTYLNVLVSNGTSGVFSGQGRPLIATILSFGLELPLSIGGVAIYILVFHGDLLGVYWFNAVSGAVEVVIVLYLIISSNWSQCAEDARQRQEAVRQGNNNAEGIEDVEDGAVSTATTDPESSSDDTGDNNEISLNGNCRS